MQRLAPLPTLRIRVVPHPFVSAEVATRCAALRAEKGFVPLDALFADLPEHADDVEAIRRAATLARIFNASFETRRRIIAAARAGDDDAASLFSWMEIQAIPSAPCTAITERRAQELEADLLADPADFLTRAERPYPYSANHLHWSFDPEWITRLLTLGRQRFEQFASERRSDTAILVGNGPSLNRTDLSRLDGQDIFISNYATRHPILSPLARGVAVSNYFVAEQAPEDFFDLGKWRVLPAGLSHVLEDDPKTIWLNALGGPLFFSDEPTERIAWHATVSFFWLQVLLGAGYRRVLLIGMDNTYHQPEAATEGTLLHQIDEDRNHFDPNYFRGKYWQAADTGHMTRVFIEADRAYRAKGAQIVNCTEGGALEVFRRSTLAAELSAIDA
ncbi:hypothetical protein [Roseovarius aquimarinus]|uniref:DUF115 domain-containing protein n=1 Tax=Roseovarius aquimarinus TaxID=1229156 RepID=A0ABW7IAD2_9RHOB